MTSFAGVSLVGDGKAVGHAIDVSTSSGYHLLVVNRYSSIKDVPNGTVIVSLPFMVGGHRWHMWFYPNGERPESADSISLFLRLVDANVAEALNVQSIFSFVDEHEKQDSAHIRASKPDNFSSCSRSWGYPSFMKRDTLEKSKHLNYNCFTIRCDLSIVTATDLFIKVPASSIKQHISGLLLSKEGTDVTFVVSGEKFAAHRCVLAARSAVLKAELFGSMKESTIASVIDVEDVEPRVFSALLNFIYTDSLPKMEIGMLEDEGEAQEALWLQHLLAAADRYALQRLKALCEEKLCTHTNVSSVTTILTLAEQHSCCGLKEAASQVVMVMGVLESLGI
ncbi:BTB/POZ and MATH domain-containing protein 1-like [Aegilops tauschii subsp. strangulata]|uniref:Speckle-type POZ protein-like protein B n=1 Tax=Aegilops tauschii TaxID=37682 RepID=M8B564_AEGTA|nr:BTB/POZ and MATH domain-containing protein 1-like [Triticum aestivum]